MSTHIPYTEEEKEKILFAVDSRPKGMTLIERCKELVVNDDTVTRWRAEAKIIKSHSKYHPTPVYTKPKGNAKTRLVRTEKNPLPVAYSGW